MEPSQVMNIRTTIISRGWIGGSFMLRSFAQRFIIEKNSWAPAMRKRPRLRWKKDAKRPFGGGVVGCSGGSSRGSVM